MGHCDRSIETNSNEFTANVHVRFNDINFSNHDDWHDVDEATISNNNNTRNIQNIRAVRSRYGWTKNCFCFGTYRLRWTGVV